MGPFSPSRLPCCHDQLRPKLRRPCRHYPPHHRHQHLGFCPLHILRLALLQHNSTSHAMHVATTRPPQVFFLPFSFCDLLRAGSTSCMHTLLWRTFTVFQCANCANPSSLCHEWPHSLHTMRMSISGRFFEPHVSLFPMSRMLERYPHFASRALQRGHENFVLAIIPLWSSRMAASSLWTQTNQPNKHRNRGAEWLQHAAQHSTPRRTSPVDHPKTLDTLGLLAAAA